MKKSFQSYYRLSKRDRRRSTRRSFPNRIALTVLLLLLAATPTSALVISIDDSTDTLIVTSSNPFSIIQVETVGEAVTIRDDFFSNLRATGLIVAFLDPGVVPSAPSPRGSTPVSDGNCL